MGSIFIQIPAYHDIEIVNTVSSAIYSASSKYCLHFGIHFNYHEFLPEQIKNIKKLENSFCKIDTHFSKAPINLGMQKSRAIANSFYDGEDYYLQIDSHMFFRQNWDEILVYDIVEMTHRYGDLIAITWLNLNYENSNDPRKHIWPDIGDSPDSNYPLNMNECDSFSRITGKLLRPKPKPDCIDDSKTHNFYNAITGAFIFTSGNYWKLVNGFPDISTGEEMITSVKLITNGYSVVGASTSVVKHLTHHPWMKSNESFTNQKTKDYEKMVLEYPRRLARIDYPESFYSQDLNFEHACRILVENDKHKCIIGNYCSFYDWVEISNMTLEGHNDDFDGWK